MARAYGYRAVDEADKQPLVDDVFHKVAGRYDVMNDLMSAGMHRLWKDAMVAALAPPRRPAGEWRVLDMAGGTGDIAFRIAQRSEGAVGVVVADINGSMLEEGRRRAERQAHGERLEFVEANAETLPWPDGHFDAYTIAFGIRNVPRMDVALGEAYRVLKPGGRFLCLEFSQVDLPILEGLYDQWSMKVIPELGHLVAGEREPYRYLVESIRRFPDQPAFAKLIANAGFERVSFCNYSGGIVALHSAWKV